MISIGQRKEKVKSIETVEFANKLQPVSTRRLSQVGFSGQPQYRDAGCSEESGVVQHGQAWMCPSQYPNVGCHMPPFTKEKFTLIGPIVHGAVPDLLQLRQQEDVCVCKLAISSRIPLLESSFPWFEWLRISGTPCFQTRPCGGFLKSRIPKSPWVSILKWSNFGMMCGTPPMLGNLHVLPRPSFWNSRMRQGSRKAVPTMVVDAPPRMEGPGSGAKCGSSLS